MLRTNFFAINAAGRLSILFLNLQILSYQYYLHFYLYGSALDYLFPKDLHQAM